MSTGTTRRQLLNKEQRSASILLAAATAFARSGFATTSMDDVAGEAGVTKLIVYRHFDTKEELYRAVLADISGRLRDELLREMQLPVPERYGFTTRAILKVARQNPDAVRLLFLHAEREPQFKQYVAELWEGAVGIALMLIGERILDPVTKAWAARSVVHYLMDGVLVWLDVGEPARDEEFTTLSTNGLLAMFGAWIDPASVDRSAILRS